MKFGFDVSGVLCDYSDRAMPDAIETVVSLLQQNHLVYSISGGKEMDGNPPRNVLQDFKDAGVVFTESLWDFGNKAAACAHMAVDMYFDDSYRNIATLTQPTQGVLVPASWDKCLRVPETVTIARNWQDIQAVITKLAGVAF